MSKKLPEIERGSGGSLPRMKPGQRKPVYQPAASQNPDAPPTHRAGRYQSARLSAVRSFRHSNAGPQDRRLSDFLFRSALICVGLRFI